MMNSAENSSGTEFIDVVFIGGGHTNVLVLKSIAMDPVLRRIKCPDGEIKKVRLLVISNHESSFYSGMLPGCIAGLYKAEEIQILMKPLCKWCGAVFVKDTVTTIDHDKKLIYLQDGEPISYDILSIDVGSTTRGLEIPGVIEHALATRPISDLLNKIETFEKNHIAFEQTPRVIVIGAGCAGIELAWAFKARFGRKFGTVNVTLVNAQSTILSEYGSWVSSSVTSKLQEKQIKVIYNTKAVKVEKEQVNLSNGTILPFDLLVWATGAEPVALLANTKFEKDEHGFIRVKDTLQTINCPFVFATGDCNSIDGYSYVAKAGVYAVRSGPFVYQNIKAMILQNPHLLKDTSKVTFSHFLPQKNFLSLLMTGDGEAISSWKGIAATGWLIWKLKDKIDRSFMNLFDTKFLPSSSYTE